MFFSHKFLYTNFFYSTDGPEIEATPAPLTPLVVGGLSSLRCVVQAVPPPSSLFWTAAGEGGEVVREGMEKWPQVGNCISVTAA